MWVFLPFFPLQASGSSSRISLLRGNLLSQKLAAFKTYGIRNDSNLPRFSTLKHVAVELPSLNSNAAHKFNL